MPRFSVHHATAIAQLMSIAGRPGIATRAQFYDRVTTTPKAWYSHPQSPKWRPVSVLDEWVAREARPVSLRQLMVFGRSLTESRLLSSANYVRTELPRRIAHRIRDMQQLPFAVVENRHMKEVYDLYYMAFDAFRKVREIKTLDDNERFCKMIRSMLKAHLKVIPKLAMGILECNGLMDAAELDKFMNTILRSRISRRVIAEQHLALTDTFHAPWFFPGAKLSETEFIGEVFLKCIAKDVVSRCAKAVRDTLQRAYGPGVQLPEVRIDGHLDANFPYILSHLEYIIGELLRNSVQAVAERHQRRRDADADPHGAPPPPPPIEVTICESQQHVVIRISDRGGGIPREVMPYLWSFSKGPATAKILANLGKVPEMAATMQELRLEREDGQGHDDGDQDRENPGTAIDGGEIGRDVDSSLARLSSRPPNLRLGMGLPLSRVYAEYWAGSLTLHSLEGYGVDAFLQISKLGNKNEQLTTRAMMDAV
ncbi:hypothetical protein VTH06DRAFT_6573 [Thermothelomyces fergusii]